MLLFNSCTSQNKEKVIEQNDISENIIQKSNEETKTNEKATKNLIKVNYNLTLKLDEKLKNFPLETQNAIKQKMGGDQTYALHVENQSSFYFLNQNLEFNSETEEKEESGKKTTTTHNYSFGYSNYYKNFENKKIVEQKFFQNNTYLVERNLITFDWKINKEIIEISGYKCKTAHTTYNGNVIKAWFTEDIPVSNGPLIYDGLPGLILKIETPDREISATKVEFVEKLEIKQPTDGIKKTKEEMDAMLNELKTRQGYEKKEGNKTESVKIIRSN